MAIDERPRLQLHRRLEEVLGEREAAILMSHLPPVGWADVATKHDLDQLGQVLTTRIEAVEGRLGSRIDGVEARLEARIDGLATRIGGLDSKVDSVEARLGDRIDRLESSLDARYEASQDKIMANTRAELLHQTRTFLLGQVGLGVTLSAALIAAVRLA